MYLKPRDTCKRLFLRPIAIYRASNGALVTLKRLRRGEYAGCYMRQPVSLTWLEFLFIYLGIYR